MANVWDAMKKHQAEQVVSGDSTVQAGTPAQALQAPPAGANANAPVAQAEPKEPAHIGNGKYAPSLLAHHDRGGGITEQYRALRTNLLARYPDERFCLLVTSAEPGEGKTVTSLNLALVLAERQDRNILVVDCDLRKRSVAALLHGADSPGMADLIAGNAQPDEVIQRTHYPNLFFVASGKVDFAKVGGLLGKPEVGEYINEFRRRFDCVLIDSPPVNIASDAGILGRFAGEAILVLRMCKTRRESADKAIRLLHAANVKLAGMVLTHQKYYIPNYLYRYS